METAWERVLQNTYLVEKELRWHIRANAGIVGLGWEDLYQEGCLALYRAALTCKDSAPFHAYARSVVRNHLLDCCRKAERAQSRLLYLTDSVGRENRTYLDLLPSPYCMEEAVEATETGQRLIELAGKCGGIIQRGMEALLLKSIGYSGTEIARQKHTAPNHVSAWIARTRARIKQERIQTEEFI